jgi:hypothetical protein
LYIPHSTAQSGERVEGLRVADILLTARKPVGRGQWLYYGFNRERCELSVIALPVNAFYADLDRSIARMVNALR